ncbi:MAG: TetR family transcriptional regulator [Streptosporangiales bacterium]|nr:TetR family transcriptional regulator [Streptosporangiales bacterium]
MSELSGRQRRRRRRSDAERSIAAILDAAIRVLSERPEASIEDIAEAAGVTRPTVYAHYRSREALLNAAIDRITEEAIAAMDAADLDHGPPAAALRRFLTAGWRTLERYPLLLRTPTMQLDPQAERDRHEPVQERLERLAKRGQDTGDFDRRLSPTWLAAATIALGHAAGEQVAAERMTADEALTALSNSVLRIFGMPPGEVAGSQTEIHNDGPRPAHR